MSFVSGWKYEDGIAEILNENNVTRDDFEEVVTVLSEWLDRQPSDEPGYLVLDGGTLTPAELAGEVRRHTQVGVSYVETFIAGAVSHKRLGLQPSLEALKHAQ